MEVEAVRRAGQAAVTEHSAGGESGSLADGHADSRQRRGERAVIEISDDDYRSFCWPCYALEEIDECKPGG